MSGMVFRDARDDSFLWSDPGLGKAQPIPRIGESVRYDQKEMIWRVTDVRHVWGPVLGVPSSDSTCVTVAVFIRPEGSVD